MSSIVLDSTQAEPDEHPELGVSWRLVRVETAARLLDTSPSSVRREIQRGRLRSVRVGEGSRRIALSDLRRYVEQLQSAAEGEDLL